MGSLHRIDRKKRDRKKTIINYVKWGISLLLCFLIFLDIQIWLLRVCDKETPENTYIVQGNLTNVETDGRGAHSNTVRFTVDGVSLYLSTNRDGTKRYYALEESQETAEIVYTKEDRRMLWWRLSPQDAFYVVDMQTVDGVYQNMEAHNREELFVLAVGTVLNLLLFSFIAIWHYVWFRMIYAKKSVKIRRKSPSII